MRSRPTRALRWALATSIAATAAFAPSPGGSAQAHALPRYTVYLETSYEDDCGYDWPTLHRLDGTKLVASPSEDDSRLIASADGRLLAYTSGSKIRTIDTASRRAHARPAASMRGRRRNWWLEPLAISDGGVLLVGTVNEDLHRSYYLFAGGRRVRTLHLPSGVQLHSASWSRSGVLAVEYTQHARTSRIGLLTVDGHLQKLGVKVDGGLAWSPSGMRLLYAFHGAIRSADMRGRNTRPLIANALLPSASPDGRIAFVRPAKKGWGVWAADAVGGHAHRLASVSAWESPSSLAWAFPKRLPLERRRSRASDC